MTHQTVTGTRPLMMWGIIAIIVILVVGLVVGLVVIYPNIQTQAELEQHYQAGLAFETAEEWEAARAEYMQVIAFDAGYKDTPARLAEVKTNLAESVAAATAVAVAQAEQARTTAQAIETTQAQATAEAQAAAPTATAQALEAHYQRALGFINLEKWVEAQAELQAIFDVDPNYKDIQAQLALVNVEVAKLIPTITATPLATPTPLETPVPTSTPVSAYSLVDDLANLTVTDGQGQGFQYHQGFPHFGWHLDPWGLVANAELRCGTDMEECRVGGSYAQGQVYIHPVSSSNPTVLSRTFSPLVHDTLSISYAMADPTIGKSNGTQIYLVLIGSTGNLVVVPPTKVTGNTWTQQTKDISAFVGQRATLRLEVDAAGVDTSDWLQVQLTLSKDK